MSENNNVQSIFIDCLFRESELKNGKPIGRYIGVQGITHDFGFHIERLNSHRDEILKLVNQLPKMGDGISFLDLCLANEGSFWSEQVNMEQIIVLGIACNYLEYLFPKETWLELPGNVPFIIRKEELAKRLVK